MTQEQVDQLLMNEATNLARLEAAIAQSTVLHNRQTKAVQRIATLEALVHNQQLLITDTTGHVLKLAQKLAEHIMPD